MVSMIDFANFPSFYFFAHLLPIFCGTTIPFSSLSNSSDYCFLPLIFFQRLSCPHKCLLRVDLRIEQSTLILYCFPCSLSTKRNLFQSLRFNWIPHTWWTDRNRWWFEGSSYGNTIFFDGLSSKKHMKLSRRKHCRATQRGLARDTFTKFASFLLKIKVQISVSISGVYF